MKLYSVLALGLVLALLAAPTEADFTMETINPENAAGSKTGGEMYPESLVQGLDQENQPSKVVPETTFTTTTEAKRYRKCDPKKYHKFANKHGLCKCKKKKRCHKGQIFSHRFCKCARYKKRCSVLYKCARPLSAVAKNVRSSKTGKLYRKCQCRKTCRSKIRCRPGTFPMAVVRTRGGRKTRGCKCVTKKQMKKISRGKSRGKCRGKVVVYQHGDFTGWKAAFGVGVYDYGKFIKAGAKNDDVSSIKVPRGCKALLAQHGDFKGWKAVFPAGVYPYKKFVAQGARNDDTSSIKVGNAIMLQVVEDDEAEDELIAPEVASP
jgi:hypothetical protein